MHIFLNDGFLDAWHDNGTEIFSRHWSCLLGIKKMLIFWSLLNLELYCVILMLLLKQKKTFKWMRTFEMNLLNDGFLDTWYDQPEIYSRRWSCLLSLKKIIFWSILNLEEYCMILVLSVKRKKFLKWFCTFQMIVSRMPDMIISLKYLLNNEVPFSAWKMLIFWSLLILDLYCVILVLSLKRKNV